MAYRPTEKTLARKHAQRQLLIDSAVTLVATNGFQGLTMVAVANQADVATGTVYKYFKDKAELCSEVFKVGAGREVDEVKEAALSDTSLPCHLRLTKAVTIFAERAIAGRKLAYALIAEPAGPLVESERLKYRKAYANIFSELLSEGIEKGEFYPQSPDLAAAAIVGLLAEMLLGPLSHDDTVVDTKQVILQIQQLCSRAFLKKASQKQ